MTAVMLAYYKEFSLTANYPKGHGKMFHDWMKRNHLNGFLFHLCRVTGSWQDIVCMDSLAIYWNRNINLEFLHERLLLQEQEHILQSNLYMVL